METRGIMGKVDWAEGLWGHEDKGHCGVREWEYEGIWQEWPGFWRVGCDEQ
jgi:hypothetical protein